MYSKNVLIWHYIRGFRTKTIIYGSDPDFRMQTPPYVERRVCEALRAVTNIKKVQIEARMWLNHRWDRSCVRPDGGCANDEKPNSSTTGFFTANQPT